MSNLYNSAELKLLIREKLLNLPNARKAGIGNKEVQLFCPFCRMDTTHGHFYVLTDTSSTDPMMFHCFKCEMSGILNSEVLHMLGIHDLQINSRLKSYNNSLPKTSKNGFRNIKTNDILLNVPRYNPDTDSLKKKYLEERLGCSFTPEELQNLKVIFNLGNFIKENKIKNLTCKKEVAQSLHEDFIGFLTAKNEFINFRDTTGKYRKKNRYYKYNIFNSLDNTKKFYTIPNMIDVMTTKDINIVLAEGVFDIISIYANIFNRETKNMIYAAMCSSGYTNVIKYFLQLGFIGENIHIHIFSDSDRDLNFYRKTILSQGISNWVGDITIYYNMVDGEKDYGVPKDRIKLSKRKL